MKPFISASAFVIVAILSFAARADVYSQTPTCAEVSMKRSGYITSDCNRVTDRAQDICAATSIAVQGYVNSDCFYLQAGGRCAVASIIEDGYVDSSCYRITNRDQDKCAEAAINKNGWVPHECFALQDTSGLTGFENLLN